MGKRNPNAAALVAKISQEHETTGKSVSELCDLYKITRAYYYSNAKKLRGGKQKRAYRKKTPPFVDIPLKTSEKIILISCTPETLKAVLEQL